MLRFAPYLLCLLLASAATASDRDVLPADLPEGPKTLMYRRFLLDQNNAALDRRSEAYELIETVDDARAYQ